MFGSASTVLVAVSGGPDSVCLLHALVRTRRLLRIRSLVAFHFDHRLRPGSAVDARYAKRQADGLAVPFVLREATSRPSKGESTEAWARFARYGAMAEVREEIGAQVAAVGHTADDQAETVLLALIRGGGIDALAGMRPLGDGVARPLLEVTREETVAFCRSLGLRPRRDPMNDDPSYLRVAIRLRGLPSLEEAVGRPVRATVIRSATLLREDADLLAAMAAEAEHAVLRTSRDGVAIRVTGLLELPLPIAARVVRSALRASGMLPEVAHVEAVMALAAGRPGRRMDLPGGLVARRQREYVSLSTGREGA
jgi:tRNA(Ile)-lysidine synthase